jgi:triacylglycerol lipase
MKKALIVIVALFIALPSVSMAATTNAATKYPIVLSHGMGAQAEILGGLIDYWGSIPSRLKENGAAVYITSVNAMDSTENKAAQWKEQVLQILAISGKEKINVIGHSHGCIYSRYAITNLGLGSKVASHTSIAGPHRGSVIADMIMGILPNWLENLGGPVLDWIVTLIMGDKNGDSVANGYALVRSIMINVFNPNTPNLPGVYYQSYAYKITNALGGGLFLATWGIMKPYEGDNDGVVSVSSAKWGNFRGVIDGGSWSWLGGLNHLGAVGLLTVLTPGYDAPKHFVNVAADLKARGY